MEGLKIAMRTWLLFAALAALVVPVRADFSYEQISQMTGGSMLRMMKMVPGGGKATQPQSSRILLKGNRLATVTSESISVIDLDAETMTSINVKDKQYSVITFAEFKQAMAAMAQKMSQGKPDGGEAAEMEFSVKVDPTGQTKAIDGLSTKQFIMTLTTGIKDKESGQDLGFKYVRLTLQYPQGGITKKVVLYTRTYSGGSWFIVAPYNWKTAKIEFLGDSQYRPSSATLKR